MTHDIDRTRLAEKAQHVIAAIKDLEALAIAGATQHERQLDALVAELDRLNNLDILSLQLPDGRVPAGIEAGLRCWYHEAAQLAERQSSSMTVGLDDVRTILEEETHPVVQHLLVIEDDKVQVIDSLHQLLAHIIAVDTAWPASEMQSLRLQLQFAQEWAHDELKKVHADLAKEIEGRVADADAEADHLADMDGDLRQAVTELIDSIRPVDVAAARLADNANPTAAIIVVAEALRELTGQILEDGEGETMRALALARADADRLETEMHAIEAVCEAGGMPPTIEREDIPAWLAEHLTTRIERKEKVKKAKKAKAKTSTPPVIEADDGLGQLSILDEVSDA